MLEEIIEAKRIKLDAEDNTDTDDCSNNDKSWKINAILPDEYYKPMKRCFLYGGVLNDTQFISKAMTELCKLVPLNELIHLKRVNKTKVILCSLNEMSNFLQENAKDESIQEILTKIHLENHVPNANELHDFNEDTTTSLLRLYLTKCRVSSDLIKLLTEKIEIAPAAVHPPVLNWQYSEVNAIWPCKFHPNKNLEKLFTGKWLTEMETIFHTKIMNICGFLCEELNKNECGIVVDPRTKSIVAIGFDENDQHPLMHCAMVLIDAVARSQKGGAWNEFLVRNENNAIYTKCSNDSEDYTQSGVSPYIRKIIATKFPSIKFGAEHVKSADENKQSNMEIDVNSDNLAKYGPYLCTGYDVYFWREPCVMCSMALTHSRIRTIFFHETQSNGAVCTLTKLQSVKALNHHFQVFQIS